MTPSKLTVLKALVTLLLYPALATAKNKPNGNEEPHPAKQMLLVVSDDWNQTPALAAAFEGTDGAWTQVGEKQNAVVGKKGMGWGLGKHPATNLPVGPQKKEGDLKAPAGIFDLTFSFGRLAISDVGNENFAYLPLHENIECVDDGDSVFYNQVVDKTKVRRVDWSSSEKMFFEPLYLIGAFVAHNSGAAKSKGSCIFLHVRPPSGGGTAGCTAFAQEAMIGFSKWFDVEKKPVLVQLPRAAYEDVKISWGLPGSF